MSVVVHNDQAYAAAFGQTIRALRRARKLSQEALAAEAGLAYSSIRAWESGRPNERCRGQTRYILPNLHNLRALCQALDLPVWKLLRTVDWRMAAGEAWKTPEGAAKDEVRSAA